MGSWGAQLGQFKKCVCRFSKRYALLLISLCVVLVIWIMNWVGLVGFYSDGNDRGTFGDMFGGVNALFTGLAFATLIYTSWMQQRELRLQRIALKLQRNELKLQRIELSHTREEIRGQKEQLQQQSKTFELQRFETTFFSLLTTHQRHLADIGIGDEVGAKALRNFWQSFRSDTESNVKDIDVILKVYLARYGRNYSQLGRYFRSLYRIFKFINSSNVEDKKFYAGIARAQLTAFEQLILFYNCLSPLGKEKFKPLVEKYSLLNNLPEDKLIHLEHKECYKKSAYK